MNVPVNMFMAPEIHRAATVEQMYISETKQEGQYKYNVTLRRVREIIVAVEKQ